MREIKHLSVHQWIRSAIPDSQQPISPIGFLFFKLPPPPCAVLLVLWIRSCPLLKLPVDIRCIASLFCCPVACRVVHFGPGIARMTRCEAARIYHCGSSQNRVQLSATQGYEPKPRCYCVSHVDVAAATNWACLLWWDRP